MGASEWVFKFGSPLCRTLVHINVRMLTPDGSHVELNPKLVVADVPLVIGIDLSEEHWLVLDFSRSSISKHKKFWTVQMITKKGHMFIEWEAKYICVTKSELQRIHLHLFHP